MKARKRVSALVGRCLLVALTATTVTLGAHGVPDLARTTLADATHAVRTHLGASDFAPLPREGKSPYSHVGSAAVAAPGKTSAVVGAVAAGGTSGLALAALALLAGIAARWMLGFIGRSSRTRGQPRAVALSH